MTDESITQQKSGVAGRLIHSCAHCLTTEKTMYGFGFGESLPKQLIKVAREKFDCELSFGEQPLVVVGNKKLVIICSERAMYLYGKRVNRSGKRIPRGSKKSSPARVAYESINLISYNPPSSLLSGTGYFSVNGYRFKVDDIFLTVPIMLLTSCLQDSLGKAVSIPLDRVKEEVEKCLSPKNQAKIIGFSIFFVVLMVLGVVFLFINPRVLAPLGLGFVALSHSAARNWRPLTVLGDIITWIVLSCMILSWIMQGF